ncbi:MAG: TRAP transporter small permease subunit, partial [Pseudomonadales bacterium]|nr:TRAP transporter small permease subunit [Pseudomonadales bacterium]
AVIAPLTLIMTLATCVIVIARYVFQTGLVPLQEIVIYMHGIVFLLGAGYTLKEKGHVRVDILYQRFSSRTRALVDLGGHLFFLTPVCAFIFFSSLDYVSLSFSMREGSAEPGGLPGVYLLKSLIPAMAALLFLQGISEALKNLLTLMNHDG